MSGVSRNLRLKMSGREILRIKKKEGFSFLELAKHLNVCTRTIYRRVRKSRGNN